MTAVCVCCEQTGQTEKSVPRPALHRLILVSDVWTSIWVQRAMWLPDLLLRLPLAGLSSSATVQRALRTHREAALCPASSTRSRRPPGLGASARPPRTRLELSQPPGRSGNPRGPLVSIHLPLSQKSSCPPARGRRGGREGGVLTAETACLRI